MKILLLESYPEIKKEYLKYLEKNNEIFELKNNFKPSEIDIIIIRSKIKVDKKLLDNYPNLKYVARVGVWLDKVDLQECEKRWIQILNTPGVNADSVADLVLWWILNLLRNLNYWFRGLENRFDYLWEELNSKSIWIIWFGNIWKKIYKRAKAFWVSKFYIFDPFLKKEDVEKNEFCEFFLKKEDLFKKSDIITFHIPLLESTKNFLWKEEFKLLKENIILVNTSRWWIIDENELIDFLQKNKQARFFADVWEEEPNQPKETLSKLQNVLLTPHIGAMTKQAEEKMHFFEKLI